jgi:hypothetical protein
MYLLGLFIASPTFFTIFSLSSSEIQNASKSVGLDCISVTDGNINSRGGNSEKTTSERLYCRGMLLVLSWHRPNDPDGS